MSCELLQPSPAVMVAATHNSFTAMESHLIKTKKAAAYEFQKDTSQGDRRCI